MSNIVFTIPQKIACRLIQSDMRYIYTIFSNSKQFNSNYIVSSMPYIGLIIDGAENWTESINSSSKAIINPFKFTIEEKKYYDDMRDSIKMWGNSYASIKAVLRDFYESSDEYFASLCRPVARKLKLYDIFGADKVNGKFCGNTILDSYYIPEYRYGEIREEDIKRMSEAAGKLVRLFGAMNEYEVNKDVEFTCDDYGGLKKSPVGNTFSDNFVLFSMLCQIQFVLYCVEEFIVGECSTKLRFEYLQYYYCAGILTEINDGIGSDFKMDTSWRCDKFRNAMAHYKVGVALKPEEVIMDDLFYGMTQKYFGCSYFELKKVIIDNLVYLAEQLKEYLQI